MIDTEQEKMTKLNKMLFDLFDIDERTLRADKYRGH